MVAVDLGAGSCRVSLLRWVDDEPGVTVVHRFENAPVEDGESLRWNIDRITTGVEEGLRLCAELASEAIASIGVDGWGVDYVRLSETGRPLTPPFCYRDTRTEAAEAAVHEIIGEHRLYVLTGLQRLRFNTVYQLYADKVAGVPAHLPWLNLPEYVLHRLGGRRVSEYTNATHTGLIDLKTRGWCTEIFDVLGLDITAAPTLVRPGADIGQLRGPLAELPVFEQTRLIAPACHDTASAIAAIAHEGDEWAYLSSGTWSLLGTIQPRPLNSEAAYRADFTNLGAAGGGICFHKSVNGMWLLRQCLDHWEKADHTFSWSNLIADAERTALPDGLLDVDHPELMLPGDMPHRINERRVQAGLLPIPETGESAGIFASLIFHSLAKRYAEVLSELASVTGKRFTTLQVVGGGAQNAFLNRLTAAATGLKVQAGHVESSTIGNFAIQMAAFERRGATSDMPLLKEVGRCARVLERASYE
jgi:rhamnulokinase